MKKSFLALFVSLSVNASPIIVDAPVEHLYVPMGFDNNDSVEVVVAGYLPNACYSRNKVSVEMKGEVIKLTVTMIAPPPERSSKFFCADLAIPFMEVVPLGNLQGGDYQVVVNDGTPVRLETKLAVTEAASSAIDDNIYAAIDRIEDKGNGNYLLHGWRYSDCLRPDRVEVVSNGVDTLSILPIMKEVGTFCPMKGMPMTMPVKLNFSRLKMKRPLVHVRTMDGRSVNTIIDLEGRR